MDESKVFRDLNGWDVSHLGGLEQGLLNIGLQVGMLMFGSGGI